MVDFSKMLEKHNEAKANGTNGEQPSTSLANFDFGSLAGFVGTSLPTISGETFIVQPGQDLEDFVPQYIPGNGEPLWTLKAGQPRNNNWREADNQWYAVRSLKDPETNTWKQEFLGPFGAEMLVFPLGTRRAQIMYPTYDEKAEDHSPLCKSNDWIKPNASFIADGTAPSTLCRVIGPNGLQEVCPMLKWSKDRNGKSIPPACTGQVVICVAFEHEGSMEVADVIFQRGSYKSGNMIAPMLRKQTRDLGLAIYAHPIRLTMAEAGVGNVPSAELLTNAAPEFTEDDHAGFGQAIAKFNKACEYLKSRAAYIPNQPQDEQEPVPAQATQAQAFRDDVNTAVNALKTKSTPKQDQITIPSGKNGKTAKSKPVQTSGDDDPLI